MTNRGMGRGIEWPHHICGQSDFEGAEVMPEDMQSKHQKQEPQFHWRRSMEGWEVRQISQSRIRVSVMGFMVEKSWPVVEGAEW